MSSKILIQASAFVEALEETAALFLVRTCKFLRGCRICEVDGYLDRLDLCITRFFEAKLLVLTLCWGVYIDDLLVFCYVHTITSLFIKFIVDVI